MADYLGLRNSLLYGDKQRPFATEALTLSGPQQTSGLPDLIGIRQAVLKQQMARKGRTPAQQLTALSPAPSLPPKRPSLGDRISGMLPTAGTPEAAGLGAAGQRMLQLSGWSDRPVAMSQILGEAAKAYTTARKETAAEQAATLKAQEELEYKRKQDQYKREQDLLELNRLKQKDLLEQRNIESQIAQRERGPVSALPAMGATREIPVEGGLTQVQQWNGTKYVDVGVPYDKRKQEKPTGFVTFFKDGDYKVVREGSKEADVLASQGYRIIESSQLTGTAEELELVGKPTRTKIEGSLLGAQEAYIELQKVREKFDPYFLTVQGKTAFNVAKAKDMIGQASLKDKELIRSYTDWQTNSWTQVNNYIKALTGAQMSEAEARRIMRSLPDPRTGYFEGMTPSQYEQALNSTIDAAARTIARSSYFLKKGLTPVRDESRKYKRDDQGKIISGDGKDVLYVMGDQVIDTDDMDDIIKKETLALREKYKGMEPNALNQKLASELSVMFGLGFDDIQKIVTSGA